MVEELPLLDGLPAVELGVELVDVGELPPFRVDLPEVGVALEDDAGGTAEYIPERSACGDRIAELAAPGDRVVIMGARDDTLTAFAKDLLARLP